MRTNPNIETIDSRFQILERPKPNAFLLGIEDLDLCILPFLKPFVSTAAGKLAARTTKANGKKNQQ